MIPERPEEPGRKQAIAFTVLVHLALVGALFLGVQWKRSQPEVMEVELWSAQPTPAMRAAPPPPSEPVPPRPEPKPEPKPEVKPQPKPEPKVEAAPKKPDIAVKEEKKKPEPKKPEPKPEPEPKKVEPKKPEPAKSEPKTPAKPADPFKEMLEREERQRRQVTAEAQLRAGAEAEQRAAAGRRGMESYAAKIRGKIRGNIFLPPNIQGNPEAIFVVTQLPTGEVLEVRQKRSSGNPALDEAIERAIRKSSPLPKPDDPAQFQRTLEIKYKPFEE